MDEGAQKMNSPTVEGMISTIQQTEGLEISDQVYMFVQLCNAETLIQHFQKQALMLKMGMATDDPVYSFAYGVLKIANPHLFVEDNDG